jgi:arginine decarboxylase
MTKTETAENQITKSPSTPVAVLPGTALVSKNGASKKWTNEDAIELYNIDGWGSDYFSVNAAGNLVMQPKGAGGPAIELVDVIEECRKQNIDLPCIIRFHDILRHRVRRMNELFIDAIETYGFQGSYRGVYPIKVNQMREIIEEILEVGAPYHFGLEAGSKAELQIVLAYNKDPEALTICNGYKDKDYIRLALLGCQLGRKVCLVIEKFSELPLIIQVAREAGVKPMLGIRGKLSTKGSGKWQESGGDLAKFGLTSSEMIRAVEYLKKEEMLDCLQLFHFHIGSQVPDIRTVKSAVQEGARYYASLRKLGAPVNYFDVGGGLGIDYDGSQSKSDFSVNYTLDEYVRDVVYQLQAVCDEEKVSHPNIVSESGRAIVAQHSCLVMNVVDSFAPSIRRSWQNSPLLKSSPLVAETYEILNQLSLRNALESFHDANAKKDEALSLFKLGRISLEERSLVEQLFADICVWIVENRKRMKRVPEEFQELESRTLQQYVVNFSVFQSCPDHWAFDQLFPIVPLHRMNERPRVNATLVDITCDSDGEIDRFISRTEVYSSALKLHPFKEGRPYYLGMFLTGAYQDIMGDMHNLFGRVNEVHVYLDDEDPDDFYIEEVIRGDNISNMLEANQYSLKDVSRMLKDQVDAKIRDGSLKPKQGVQLIDFYDRVLQDYTYLHKGF